MSAFMVLVLDCLVGGVGKGDVPRLRSAMVSQDASDLGGFVG